MGETRVDLQHLLEDLRDAYSGSIEESIVTEVVANALDAGASTITISTAPGEATLTIVDDGRGMLRRELARYHDIATSRKRRGEGIGFAGVGIKLGLLVSREVLTEARRGSTHVASSWSLTARHRAPWKWVPPPGLVTTSHGTAVRLTLTNPLSALVDAGFLEETLRRHFEPLLDVGFEPILKRQYPHRIRIAVDGRPLTRTPVAGIEVAPIAIRLARKRTPSAVGYLSRHSTSLPEDQSGIAISTFGKVIKRGWDWLGLSPVAADRIEGLIEAPDLAECLTLNKNDFQRTGARGATYLAYRKALQEVVSRQLTEWGDERASTPPARSSRLGRDLERVLEDLARQFPLLQSLVERRRGGQKRLPIADGTGDEGVAPLVAMTSLETPEGPLSEAPVEPPAGPADSGPPAAPMDKATLGSKSSTRRRMHFGLSIQFESRPEDDEPGRLVENTIWVNRAHPAFERASGSRSLGYHLALTVALALAPLAATPAEEHIFLTRFLAEWGGSGRSSGAGRSSGSGRSGGAGGPSG